MNDTEYLNKIKNFITDNNENNHNQSNNISININGKFNMNISNFDEDNLIKD